LTEIHRRATTSSGFTAGVRPVRLTALRQKPLDALSAGDIWFGILPLLGIEEW